MPWAKRDAPFRVQIPHKSEIKHLLRQGSAFSDLTLPPSEEAQHVRTRHGYSLSLSIAGFGFALFQYSSSRMAFSSSPEGA